ncbi:hypothetical protein AgCh_040303 [Apium graveolens]
MHSDRAVLDGNKAEDVAWDSARSVKPLIACDSGASAVRGAPFVDLGLCFPARPVPKKQAIKAAGSASSKQIEMAKLHWSYVLAKNKDLSNWDPTETINLCNSTGEKMRSATEMWSLVKRAED